MSNCPSCASELPERAFYCPSCGTQAKCKNCRVILEPKAHFCVECGTPVGDGNLAQSEEAIRPKADSQRNIIEFSETVKGRRFRADVNNEAVKSLSQPLAEIIASRLTRQGNYGKHQVVDPNATAIDGSMLDPNADDYQTYGDSSPHIDGGAKALPLNSDLEVLQRIFRRTSDNKWKINDSRLGQNSKIDFAKRLMVLFLLLHQLEGRESILRSELSEILSDASLDDGNVRTWITNTDFLHSDGTSVTLLLPGRDFAHKVIKEYLNPQTETSWSSESRSRRRVPQSPSAEKEEKPDEGSKTSKNKRAQGTSYRAQTTKLFESGFFSENRTGPEVKAELERLGHKFTLGRVTDALLSLTKRKKLDRTQKPSGEWIYKKQ